MGSGRHLVARRPLALDTPRAGRSPLLGRRALVLVLVAATTLRVGLIVAGWPVTNSDEATMGLMARHILQGSDRPIFFYGQSYMGSAQAYLGAALSYLGLDLLLALRLGLVLMFVLFLLAAHALASSLYDRDFALVTVVVLAFGSTTVMQVELRANGGYMETLLCAAVLLLVAVQLTQSLAGSLTAPSRRVAGYGAWGLAVGFGLWSDPLIVPFVLASGVLLLVFCRRELLRRGSIALLAGLIIGSAPLLTYNLAAHIGRDDSFSILRQLHRAGTSGSQATAGQLLRQVDGAVTVSLPDITGGSAPVNRSIGAPWLDNPPSGARLAGLVWGCSGLILWTVSTAATLGEWWSRRHERPGGQPTRVRLAWRLALLGGAAFTFLAYATSPAAAATPKTSAQYLLGLLVATPAVLAPVWGRETRPPHSS
jgi:hypothetical protein